ncbi:hypothetical protein HanIR_Chr14g0707171 [Helianthus annuus]|nr:hypothetical protein HanIR_Chr14g0707171 [Helianthus annuus]
MLDNPLQNHSPCPPCIPYTLVRMITQIINRFRKHTHCRLHLIHYHPHPFNILFLDHKISTLQHTLHISPQFINQNFDIVQIFYHNITTNLHCTHHPFLISKLLLILLPQRTNPLPHRP